MKNKGLECQVSPQKREELYYNINSLDYNKKILQASWHPKENIVALAATNNLFLFQRV